eukprot:TRINITY_DN2981_c0_g1_i7.p1 TRINITY_DN2981_c0_g1~~TRINITY_DN2981_c0_g1_i7.p1  ORF type:complete len:247 (-),score=80.54 TRINITY_DN2981_c0_g1_i7:91-744(-)
MFKEFIDNILDLILKHSLIFSIIFLYLLLYRIIPFHYHLSTLFRIIKSFFLSKKINLFEGEILYRRVWLGDLDYNFHMNNAHYSLQGDYGRTSLIINSGLWNWARKKNIYVALGGSYFWFIKSLKPFQKFTIETRVAGWDKKWIYFVIVIRCMKKEIYSIGLSKMVAKKGRQTIEPTQAFSEMDLTNEMQDTQNIQFGNISMQSIEQIENLLKNKVK